MVDQKILTFLSKLDIPQEEARIYTALIGKQAQTAQEIAKTTSIPKTTIYRRIEELKKLGIVEEQIDEYKKVFTAASVDHLNLLVIEKEQKIKELRAELPDVTQLLTGPSIDLDPNTKVLFYRGRDGIRQMLWNDLRSQTEIIGYTYRDITLFTGKNFADRWNEEFKRTKLKARDLYSDEYLKSKFEQNNPKIIGWSGWQSRYISPKVLDITHQMDIYNDVVGIYSWHEGEVFGVEIYNEKVAKLQKQLFEAMWKTGKPLTFVEQEHTMKKVR